MPNQFTHPWTEQELDFLFKSYQTLSYGDIGRILRRSYSSIQSKVRNNKVHKRIGKHAINSHFFKTWSAEMAYVLGFITANGNLQQVKKGYHMHIACDDYDIIEKIRRVMRSATPIREKPRFNGKVSYSLRFSDKSIFQDLLRFDITPKKSLTIKPTAIPEVYYWHYIRGFFDGDGCVSIYNSKYPSKLHTVSYTGSKDLAEFLYKTLIPFFPGYKGRIIKKKNKNNFVIHFGQKHSEMLFKYMYTNASIFMDRKYNTFLKGIRNEFR